MLHVSTEIFCGRPQWREQQRMHVQFPWEYKYSYEHNESVNYRCDDSYKKTKDTATCTIQGWIPSIFCGMWILLYFIVFLHRYHMCDDDSNVKIIYLLLWCQI